MNRFAIAALGIVNMFAPMAANAGQISDRLKHQEYRIYRGVKQGQISRQEYRKLERYEESIEAQRRRALRSGGKLSIAEKQRLKQRLDRQSARIYRDRHDR